MCLYDNNELYKNESIIDFYKQYFNNYEKYKSRNLNSYFGVYINVSFMHNDIHKTHSIQSFLKLDSVAGQLTKNSLQQEYKAQLEIKKLHDKIYEIKNNIKNYKN